MRHRVKGRKLGRTKPHRAATLRALSSALIKEHRIETTLPKAKELRTFIEPLITTAKVDSSHNRRKVFSALQDKRAVTELFTVVGPAAVDRPGGYTRVLKLGFRFGDSAEMAVIELVDFNDVQPEQKTAKKKRTRRAGKSAKPTTASKADSADDKQDDVSDTVLEEKSTKSIDTTTSSEKESAKDSGNEEINVSEDKKEDSDTVSKKGKATKDSNTDSESETVAEEKESSDKKTDDSK